MADRQGAAAVALRLAGASFAEVADALGLANPTTARTMVVAHLALTVPDDESREAMRQEESHRLERLLRGVWGKATDPGHPEHLPAAKVALSIIDRHARLHGLDSPAEVVVHSPTATEIDAWVASLTAAATEPLAALEAPVADTIA